MSRFGADIARSTFAGASTGGRTFTAFEALALSVPEGATSQPDAVLATPAVRGVIGLLAVGEIIGDKLPMTPSRLQAPGFVGRLVFGALCGAVIARRDPAPEAGPGEEIPADPTAISGGDASDTTVRTVACAAVGAASAAATAWLGAKWRATCAGWLRRDWVGAELEDAAVAALAAAAARAR